MLEVCVIVLLDLLIVQQGGAIGESQHAHAVFSPGHSDADQSKWSEAIRARKKKKFNCSKNETRPRID